MNGIRVELGKATPEGRIYPRYDEESQLIIAGNRLVREWPFGINIDSTVILDAGPDRVLASVEVIMRRELWSLDECFGRPRRGKAANLVLTKQALLDPDYSLAVIISTNGARSAALVSFGGIGGNLQGIELSGGCTALIDGDMLQGFFFDLA